MQFLCRLDVYLQNPVYILRNMWIGNVVS